tara:strand:+ start:42 stop:848 length:807 start_codon:yes stop_codon:yes gene_type:complete
MRVITWNINSVRLRINSVKKAVKKLNPDILCLQETKCLKEDFPFQDFKDMGFVNTETYGIKGYNGVCVASKHPITSVNKQIFYKKDDARHINIEFAYKKKKIKIHNFYVPAGGDEPDPKVNDKFKHKIKFLDEATKLFYDKKSKNKDHVILVGDLNIAPHENDVWSHQQLKNVVSHTEIEIKKLNKFMKSFLFEDAIRFTQGYDKKIYSWWSYRAKDWKKSNRGRRLDHIWVSQQMAKYLERTFIEENIRGWQRPSDHVPVVADFKFN